MIAMMAAFAGPTSENVADGQHPEPLAERRGCDRWQGEAHGNDPDTRITLLVCPSGEEVRGELQWSSLNSGWNVRQLSGRRTQDGYVLRDVGILKSNPKPGWRFCEIEEYRLTRFGNRLEGTYTSSACDDTATLRLEAFGQVSDSVLSPPPDRSDLSDPTPASGLCAVVGLGSSSGMWGFVWLVARRRRSQIT